MIYYFFFLNRVERIVFSGTSGTHPILIADEGHLRSLRFGFNASKQSCMDLEEPYRLQLAYTRWMMAALLLHPAPSRFLLLGLGGGSIVRFLLHYLPHAHIDVVEKSDTVIRLARGYFGLPTCRNLQVLHQDADHFLHSDPTEPYDIAFIDIFGPDHMAFPLFDRQFYTGVLDRLARKGVMAINLWSGNKEQYRAVVSAVSEACPDRLLQLQVKKRSNVILLGFADEIPKKRLREVRKNIQPHQQHYGLNFPRYLKQLRRTNRSFLSSFISKG